MTDKETAARDGAGEHAADNVMHKREKPVRLFNPSANRRPSPNPYPSSFDRNCTQRRAAEPLGSPAARIVVLVVFLRALVVARLSSLETDSGRRTYSTYAGCAVTARACASAVISMHAVYVYHVALPSDLNGRYNIGVDEEYSARLVAEREKQGGTDLGPLLNTNGPVAQAQGMVHAFP